MFKKILIANRGEIAVRVIAACRELGVQTVAIFSEPDRESRHVQLSDEQWRLEGQPARVYLDHAQILDIARKAGVDAVHPGYGFLSENAEFAQACLDAGIKFIGPTPAVIRAMGSKVEARRAMEAAGVPVVPGTTDPVTDPKIVKELATKYGYPVAIKASAGGGGRGLKVVRNEQEVENALSSAQREGQSYFGSNEVYVEKYLDASRHIEVQVLGDEHGNVIHLGERDCSSQRRHQKLLEESPAVKLGAEVRKRLLEAAVRGAASLKYSSAGTLEFLVSGDEFYFLEVNTRVQVEHPITELVTGVDIVKEQILVADGNKLSLTQDDVEFRGHAIEFRINAEDALKNFMPSPGVVHTYAEPRLPWTRIDSACYQGYQILPFYDSLLAKLIVWGRDREEAIVRGKLALNSYDIKGVATTIPFQLAILDDSKFRAGEMTTKYVEAELIKDFIARHQALAATASSAGQAEKKTNDSSPSLNSDSSSKTTRSFEVEVNQKIYKVAVTDTSPAPVAAAGNSRAAVAAPVPARAARPMPERASRKSAQSSGSGEVRTSMNGLVKDLFVKVGDTVSVGQKIALFEAMKMEQEILAATAGKVSSIDVKPGDTVESQALLMVISPN
ncbi:MAG: acetyl-CoA carboxylase biotin carboxylase subunit [Candidatus Obscuribacterales bacterium]|nr:acetyl-CoA carboxylase biotin carboxylase subunit [Cyanobacteria bacterium SZAS LIN-5]RTL44841.1 MAG: acetyl-CoA carboxylase biotin carboxylase subunit [Candidatus Melainabacteria bacterium]